MFLHDSVKTDSFKRDKKLQLLKKGVITIAQFVNLIEPKDNYIVIGPAIVAKTSVADFLTEWKMRQLNIDESMKFSANGISVDEMMKELPKLMKIFPEIKPYMEELSMQLKTAMCSSCVKKQYMGTIANVIKKYKDDGRDLSPALDSVNAIMMKYFNEGELKKDEELLESYDTEWIKPESILGLGEDLIENLPHCFDCVMKHLGRAKILFEEMTLGYPNYKSMVIDELKEGDENLDKAYLAYIDAVSHLDMASAELVGDITSLPREFAVDIIEMANKIRGERLLFQQDIGNIPDFDNLRIEVKKLQLKISSYKQ